MRRAVAVGLTLILLGGFAGCAAPPPPVDTTAVPVAPLPPVTSDQTLLKEGLTGRTLSPTEVADLSDRLLAQGSNTFNDQETMARLELLILKAMKSPDKTHRAVLWRNLGIIHYHEKKYKQARQELQAANEINPRNARTHFYLACLFAHEGKIYEIQSRKSLLSKKKRAARKYELKSRQQFKRAVIEMEQAHKLEPSNSLFKQDPKQVIQQENGK